MIVGDLVMILRPGKKSRPGMILQFDDQNTDVALVLTGPRQVWISVDALEPFTAASMAQTRRLRAVLDAAQRKIEEQDNE